MSVEKLRITCNLAFDEIYSPSQSPVGRIHRSYVNVFQWPQKMILVIKRFAKMSKNVCLTSLCQSQSEIKREWKSVSESTLTCQMNAFRAPLGHLLRKMCHILLVKFYWIFKHWAASPQSRPIRLRHFECNFIFWNYCENYDIACDPLGTRQMAIDGRSLPHKNSYSFNDFQMRCEPFRVVDGKPRV